VISYDTLLLEICSPSARGQPRPETGRHYIRAWANWREKYGRVIVPDVAEIPVTFAPLRLQCSTSTIRQYLAAIYQQKKLERF
jgi:hypothetical protein